MKITPTIEDIACEVEAWGFDSGWKNAAIKTSDEYHKHYTGDLLPATDSELGIRNASQRLRRIFRGGGKQYREMALQLAPAALSAMPKMRSMKLTEPNSVRYLSAKVTNQFGDAISSVMVRCPSATEKLTRLIESLQALIPALEMITQ